LAAPLPSGRGLPQIQAPFSSMVSARFGGGGGWGYGPQATDPRRKYQLANRPGGRTGGDSPEGGLGQPTGGPGPALAGGLPGIGGSLGQILGGMGMGRGAGAAPFQEFGQPPNRRDMGLGGIEEQRYNTPEGLNRSREGFGLERLRGLSDAALSFRGMAPMQRNVGGYGAPEGGPMDSILRKLVMARMGGGMF
jgi:hypothetical protein